MSSEPTDAEKFWGKCGTPQSVQMFTLLVISIYDCVRSIAPPVPEIEDDNKARPYVNPEMFRIVLKLLDIHDLDISNGDQKFLNLERLDKLHREYYELWGMKFEDFPRADGKTKAPLLRKSFLYGYLNIRCAMDPDECHTQFNKMLASKNIQFLDPFRDEKWAYPVIPRSFFYTNRLPGPATGQGLLNGLSWRVKRTKLMDEFKEEAEKEASKQESMVQHMQNQQMQGMINQMKNMSMMNAANAGLRAQQQFAAAQANAFAAQDSALGLPSPTYSFRYGSPGNF